MKLLDDGLQIWDDFEGAGGAHLYTVPGAALLEDFVVVNGREELTLELPRNEDAWDHIAKRRIIRVEFEDGTIDEYRIATFEEQHSTRQFNGRVVAEGAIMELNGPGLCELVYDSGDVVHAFELLSMTATEHLDEVILPAGPSWITRGTIDPTDLVDLTYDRFTPLRALQALLDSTVTERHLIRQAGGAYQINVLDQRGGSASTAVVVLGKNLRSSARQTDDRKTITRLYPVGVDSDSGQARLQHARFVVTSRDLGADWVVLEVTQRGRTVKAAWQDDALNGLRVGNPDGTELQLISDSVNSNGRVFVPDASLYAVSDELQLYETAGGKRLAFLEDNTKTSSDTDRRPESTVYDDLPPARNFAPNPRLDQYTAGNPDDWTDVGTPTTVAEDTQFKFHDIGSSSLQVVCDAADEGVECANITLVPSDDSPYFTAWIKIWIVSGRVRFQLDHSLLGVFPPLDSDQGSKKLAISSLKGAWVELIIQPGTQNLLTAGTVQLQVLSEGGAAEFFIDGAMLTQTAALTPFFDGQPAIELWDRAAQRFLGSLVSTETRRYTIGVADLSDTTAPFDALTVGADVELEDPNLAIDVTTRLKSLRRDLLRPALVVMELDALRGRFTETAIRRRERRRVSVDVEESLTLTDFYIEFAPADGQLILVFTPSPAVKAIKFDSSMSARPTRADAIAGTSITVLGGNIRFATALRFTPGDLVLVTAVPTDATGAGGKQGHTYEASSVAPPRGPQVTQVDLLIDETDGAVIVWMEINEEVASIRYATAVGATPSWPTDANVEAGTVVNATTAVDVTLAAGTIGPAETLRVRAAPYELANGVGSTGAGEHGPIAAQEVAWRPQRGAITHTIRVPFGDLVPLDDSTSWVFAQAALGPNVTGSIQTFVGPVLVPPGITITNVAARMWLDGVDGVVASCRFSRVLEDATFATIQFLNLTTTDAWTTVSAAISEVVATDRLYTLTVSLHVAAGGNVALDARFMFFEFTYTRDDDVNDSY